MGDDLSLKIKALKRDRLIFQKIMDISTDGFLIVDQEGCIIDINNAYCTYLGLAREEIVGKPVLAVIKNSRLPEILKTGETEVNVLHKLVEGQAPNKEKVVAVNRAAVKDGDKVIAAVGQVKFSQKTVELAQKLKEIDQELKYYKEELKRIIGTKYSFENMIGQDPEFIEVKKVAEKAAKNDFAVLIQGETGTGKEVFAHAIHFASGRKDRPFVRVNCAAIPGELLESELFGYEEGSFTGAKKGGKKGKFELADGGTIFLDEIGDMPLNMQAKILRVLQEKEVEKVGGDQPIPVNVRVIAATNQDLEHKVKHNAFRADLYYRLNVIQLKIPALKERVQDIPLFIDYFLNELNEKYGTAVGIAPETKKLLQGYGWPGNIRELRNVMERAFSLVEGNMILNMHLPVNILSNPKISSLAQQKRTLDSLIEEIEREILLNVLQKNNYNCCLSARELGIHRSTLYRKCEKLKIPVKNI